MPFTTHLSAVTSPNYLAYLSVLRSYLGIKQMPSEARTESGLNSSWGWGILTRDVSSLLAKSGARIQSSPFFPLAPKYPGTVFSGWAMSFHGGNLSWYRNLRQMAEVLAA